MFPENNCYSVARLTISSLGMAPTLCHIYTNFYHWPIPWPCVMAAVASVAAPACNANVHARTVDYPAPNYSPTIYGVAVEVARAKRIC